MRVFKKNLLNYISLENMLFLIIFLLPTYLIKINFFNIPTNFLELLIIVNFVWWIISRKHNKEQIKKFLLKYEKYFLSISLILIGSLLSLFINGNYRAGLGIIKGWFILPIIFFIISLDMLDFRKTNKILSVFYLSAFCVSISSLFYWAGHFLTYDGRLRAIFNSPNYLAMYLAPAIIIGMVKFKENKNFYLISMGVVITTLYLTFSYAAWLAAATSSFLVAMVFLVKNRKLKYIFGIIIFSFLVGAACLQMSSTKIKGLVTFNERSSLASRVMVWKTSQSLIRDNFILGIGPGNFQDKYLKYQEFFPPYLEWAVPHPHNTFLTFWLYSGAIGLVGFLLLLILFFKDFSRKQKNALKFMALGVMLYVLIHGLVDTTYFKNDLSMIFWMVYLGMIKSNEL